MTATAEVCPVCGGSGWKMASNGNERRVSRCECRQQKRSTSLLESAHIPKRYQSNELYTFITEFNGVHDRPLVTARLAAGKFVEEYPVVDKGLLLVGGIGSGKTHLAVGILKELMRSKSIPALFCDYRELIRDIRESYDPSVNTTEMRVLQPVFETELLLLDDLGASKGSAFEVDTVGYILNRRYSDKRCTLITTYLADEASPLSTAGERPVAYSKAGRSEQEAREVMRDKTLGERIGDQIRAKVHEMCKRVDLGGKDFRQRVSQMDNAKAM